ncbi:meiosis protein SPO22/ZIP4 like-domain-containing protein [Xylariales sp. AK1849]|nr:meiosis protein SPO22/ZIP4 like-domain-containing protein [Xylariales sp. AK1849]
MASDGSDSHTAAKDTRSDSDANGDATSKDSTPTTTTVPTSSATDNNNKSPRKRRKVNHACVYCRRSERPCTRCIKRNIGHLCHDEPRDPDSKKSKAPHAAAAHDESEVQADMAQNSIDQTAATTAMGPPGFDSSGASQSTKQGFGAGAGALGRANPLQLVSPNPVSGIRASASSSNINQFAGFSDAWLTAQNQFQDMHSYNPQYMLAPEVTHEFNLLNDFLNTSLLDDSGSLPEDQNLFRTNQSDMAGFPGGSSNLLPPSATQGGSMLPPNAEHGNSISRPASVIPTDKTREFYLQAADPSGNDNPEERMQRVLKAKYDAGLLKPFSYIKGYARLGKYMDSHIANASKQKILRQLDRFRPKFREKVHNLTDMELIYVEMWFERTLLEYDRVFAAMAVPACCWRRTGEIFRGNMEMAELIHVPVERLRDGKISLHEILTEESLVRYWEEFGTIAFDPAHDTLLTACALKTPDDQSHDPIVNCCFSFLIRRDDHKIILEAQIRTIKSCTLRGSQRHEQLDTAGTALWNLCTRLNRDHDGDVVQSTRKALLYSRVFAFLVLNLAQRIGRDTPSNLIRLAKVAMKTGRSYEGELEFALLALQKAAEYKDSLQKLQGTLLEDEDIACRRLEAEWFILRTALSWKEGRLDIAEHMYSKSAPLRQGLDPTSAEDLTDTLYEIGSDFLRKNDFTMAVKWLERAYEFLNNQALEHLSREAIELRLAISQALIQALLGSDNTESFQKAENHVNYIESEIGDKFVVLLLRLEILLKASVEVFDSNAYANVLQRMFINLDLSDSSFKLVIYHIRRLDDKSPSLACQVLDEFLVSQIIPSRRNEWLERAIVLRAYISTNRRDAPETVESLKSIFDRVAASTERPLAATAALAILALIWKKVDAKFAQEDFGSCEDWCRLAMHSVLEQCGPINVAKIIRKLLLCALEKNELDSAKEMFGSMSESTKTQPMTIYLAYKLALRSGDRELASQLIETVSASAPKDPKFLYACCIDAQESGDKLCALEALKQLAEKHQWSKPGPVHMPALLRVMIRLQVAIFDEYSLPEAERDLVVEDLCEVYEGVLYSTLRAIINEIWLLERFDITKLAKYLRCLMQATLPSNADIPLRIIEETCGRVKEAAQTENTFPALELEWFATTAFNHGIDCYQSQEDELSKKWIHHAFTLAHYHLDGGVLEKHLQDQYTQLRWD